jgi:anti-sigma regulatory factor (Ser/Thr protein kinase)
MTVKAAIDRLPSVKQFLDEAVGPEFRFLLPKVELAVEELLVNTAGYAYGGSEGEAEISCGQISFDGRPYLKISLRDWGRPFDPFGQAPEPDTAADLSARPVGGLGVFLVKKLVSHYYYEYDGTNRIELFFGPPDI